MYGRSNRKVTINPQLRMLSTAGIAWKITKEHAVIPVYSASDCNDLGDDLASPTKQYIYACQREQVGGLSCASFGLMGKQDS